MATLSYSVPCTKKELIAPNVYELRLEKPENFTFKPGQFLLFDIPLLNDTTDIQPRACSIASTPDELDLLFVIKLKQGGRMSEWIKNTLAVGAIVTMKGPFGLFTLKPSNHDIVFAGTGAGIAPLRSQILHALKQRDGRSMKLLFGARTKDDLFWMEEFRTLELQHENFHVQICLSMDDPKQLEERGRIQKFLPRAITHPETTDLYVCGAPEMVGDIKNMALETLMLPKSNVHAEGYI